MSNDEWRTPPKYVEMARRAMGGIDVDPASSDIAQETVKAREDYYTERDNGLYQIWRGNVWLNPPYSAQKIHAFTLKLLYEYESGSTKQAVVLTNSATDTQWFHMLLRDCLLYTSDAADE